MWGSPVFEIEIVVNFIKKYIYIYWKRGCFTMRNYAERFTLTLDIIWYKIVWIHPCQLEYKNLLVFFQSALTWKQHIVQSRLLYFLSCVLSHGVFVVYWPPLRQSHQKQTSILKIQLSRLCIFWFFIFFIFCTILIFFGTELTFSGRKVNFIWH